MAPRPRVGAAAALLLAAAAAAAALVTVAPAPAVAGGFGWDDKWRSGRATWYGGPDDPTMDENEGACLNQGYVKRPVHDY